MHFAEVPGLQPHTPWMQDHVPEPAQSTVGGHAHKTSPMAREAAPLAPQPSQQLRRAAGAMANLTASGGRGTALPPVVRPGILWWQRCVQVRAATVGTAEDGTVCVNVELTHFTAQVSAAPCGLTAHTADPLLVTDGNQAVSDWHGDGGGCEAGTD